MAALPAHKRQGSYEYAHTPLNNSNIHGQDDEGRVYNPYEYTGDHQLQEGNTEYRDDAFVPPGQGGYGGLEKGRKLTHSRESSYTGANVLQRSRAEPAVEGFKYKDNQNLWTKGSRVRCCGRYFCCSLMTIVFLVVSIIITLVLWLRPPNITFGQINASTASAKLSIQSGQFSFPVSLNISVDNPNYISPTFSSIVAKATYPNTNVNIGGGNLTNVNFPSHSTKNLVFPFTISYNVADDSNLTVLKDLASKCIGSGSSQITIDYKITLNIRILANISPTFSSSASLVCPLSSSQIKQIAGNLLGG